MTDRPRPKRVSGAKPEVGHYDDFMANAAHFMYRAYQECGELAEFDLFGQPHFLMTGPAAHAAVYRAGEDELSAAAPYQYMVPIFGEGIQYGAPLDIERQQVRFMSDALRPRRMKTYAGVIADEVEQYVSAWGDSGEKEIHDTFKDLVLYTSIHCLMGTDFRTRFVDHFGELFMQLEHAISPEAVVDFESEAVAFAKRDEARGRLQDMLMVAVRERLAQLPGLGDEGRPEDMLQSFLDARYKDGSPMAHELIPGMMVWVMFGGWHTSSNTAAWACIELAKHPHLQREVIAEIDTLFANGETLSFASLREMPRTEAFVNETLRLHPPLCVLMRQVVNQPFEYAGNVFDVGTNLVISPYVSHRVPEVFPDPETFDPHRRMPENAYGYIPFGGGKRQCVGNAFAFLQVKSILAGLLQHYELELVAAPETYREIMPSLILRPSEGSMIRYRRRRK